MNKLKVLFFSDKDHYYGAANSLFDLVSEFKNKKMVEPIVITCSRGPLNDRLSNIGVENYYVNYYPFMVGDSILFTIGKGYFHKVRYKIFNKLAIRKINKIINLKEIQLIYSNVNRFNIGAELSKKFRIPHIWHIREFVNKDYKLNILIKNYIKYMNINADSYITISDAIREEWLNKGLDKNKTIRIYNGIDFENIELKSPNNNKKLKIIFTGSINETKQQIQLIKAYNMLNFEYAKNIEINFYGDGDHKYIDYLKSLIQFDRYSNIKFCGYTNNLKMLLKNHDIGIICSKAEGFGRVTVEYMAAGLFVIASNTGANKEIVKNDRGILYEYGNVEELSKAIAYVYKCKEKLNENSYYIRNSAMNEFNKSRYANEVFNEIKKTINTEKSFKS